MPTRPWIIVVLLLGSLSTMVSVSAAAEPAATMPRYRIDPTDFDASEADIRAVCDSAGAQLWRHFHDYDLEPFVVTRSRQGPIVLYQRNDMKEIVLKLDTGNTFWSQYAYQFGHEFCHLLCGYRAGDNQNRWFEETLCETASLYVMRAMAQEWKDKPPYPHWADYRDSLRAYTDDVIRQRQHLESIHAHGLVQFYREHADQLRRDPNARELNGAMAVVLLHQFERQPEHWEAIRWLNTGETPRDEPLAGYLGRWHKSAPEKHQAFIRRLALLYGIELDEAIE